MALSKNKEALLDKALKNENNELAGFNLLGDIETLEIMAEAEKEGKTAVFYFSEGTEELGNIKYKFV